MLYSPRPASSGYIHPRSQESSWTTAFLSSSSPSTKPAHPGLSPGERPPSPSESHGDPSEHGFRLQYAPFIFTEALMKSFGMFRGRFNAKTTKPFTLNCALLLLVFGYAFAGGLVFDKLERDALRQSAIMDRQHKLKCVILHLSTRNSSSPGFAEAIADCFAIPRDIRSEWSFVTATLYGFGVVTTLGYNRIAPITYSGRLFCIVYGLCGIPFTMIIIANVGQYLNQFAGDSRKKIDFFNGLYYNFLCLTAIDFGQLVPSKFVFLPITFLYVVLGLAITTIAIDIGSEYLKKLHNLGKKMKNAAQTRIWFGGKTLKVKDLLHAVGKKCGVDSTIIDALDLENVVERTIAIKEGREPPADTNEAEESRPPSLPPASPPSSAASPTDEIPFITNSERRSPSPELVIRNPIFQSSSEIHQEPIHEVYDELEVRVEIPDSVLVDVGNLCSPSEVFFICPKVEERVLWERCPTECPAIVEPVSSPVVETSVMMAPRSPRLRPRTTSPSSNEAPKKFQEKKERYGRDPNLLFQTYQEEWSRLERLSATKSPRRKSLLNQISTRSTNNLDITSDRKESTKSTK